ncbi:hypothetical protein [Streptomyces parvulus]|uniref:hypothetical protein n=1 Tax=Streptomyces parvulus TaxID=146923 RepID=UPI0036FFB727
MSTRKLALVAPAVALLTGCGRTADDLFSNLNGTGSQESTERGPRSSGWRRRIASRWRC